MKLPQVSLRELFLLVVIAAMGCGWWVDHRRYAPYEKQISAHRKALAKAAIGPFSGLPNFNVYYDKDGISLDLIDNGPGTHSFFPYDP